MFGWEPEGRYRHRLNVKQHRFTVVNGTSFNSVNALLALNWWDMYSLYTPSSSCLQTWGGSWFCCHSWLSSSSHHQTWLPCGGRVRLGPQPPPLDPSHNAPLKEKEASHAESTSSITWSLMISLDTLVL